MKINDIVNVTKEEIIINDKGEYDVNNVTINFKFTSKAKRPVRIDNSNKRYNAQYGMVSINNCNYKDALDYCEKYAEKIKNDYGFDVAFPCGNYSTCFTFKFQVIFGKEIKEGE